MVCYQVKQFKANARATRGFLKANFDPFYSFCDIVSFAFENKNNFIWANHRLKWILHPQNRKPIDTHLVPILGQ